MSQLLLGIGLRDSATFDNFYSGTNATVVAALREGVEPFVFLWGGSGSGKSHLLQALCQQVAEAGGLVAYLPLGEAGLQAAMLEGLEEMDLVAIDDLDAVVGRAEWEEALFHLYNRMRDHGHRLVVAASATANRLPLRLADLSSRLAWGLTLHLEALDDAGRVGILQVRARNRGFDLPEEVALYLLRRCDRDMESLMTLLERLDTASLQAQRKLTIPFVKSLLL